MRNPHWSGTFTMHSPLPILERPIHQLWYGSFPVVHHLFRASNGRDDQHEWTPGEPPLSILLTAADICIVLGAPVHDLPGNIHMGTRLA